MEREGKKRRREGGREGGRETDRQFPETIALAVS